MRRNCLYFLGASYRKTKPSVSRSKITFVGQSTYFEACALSESTAVIEPSFIDFRSGDDPKSLTHALEQIRPDVVIAFKPEAIPQGALATTPAKRIGWFTEPLPRDVSNADLDTAELSSSKDLQRRLDSAKTVDADNFDHFIVFDPFIAPTVSKFVDVWQAIPLPVDDSYFQEVRPARFPARISFFGRPTVHRDAMLGPSLHKFDVRYIAHGVFGNDLKEMLFNTDIGINLHNERYPNFENRISMHLAAGNLVVSEPLSPTHGLEPGIDFLEVRTPEELLAGLEELRMFPESGRLMRQRGHDKAEYFRASKVYEELLNNL